MSRLKENRSHDVEGKNGVKYKRNPKGQWVVVDPGKVRGLRKRQIIKKPSLIKKLNNALIATHDVVDNKGTAYDLDAYTNKWRVAVPGPGTTFERGEVIIDAGTKDLLNKLYDKSQNKKQSLRQKLARMVTGTPERDTQEIQTNSLKPVRLSTILFEQHRPKHRNMISEGGSLPGVGAIHIDEIEPTLRNLSSILGIDLMDNALGSVGKREFSGDIDVALDIASEDIPDFMEKLKKIPEISDISKSSVIMTKVKIQDYDPSKQTNRPRTGYVQVDFMPGDPEWMKTFYHSPRESESKYKGVYRNILLSSIAAVLDYDASAETTPDGRPLEARRFMWSSSDGLIRVLRKPVPKKKGDGYTKQNTNKIIDGPWKKPADIVKVLKLDDPADLNSYESLKAAIERNYPSETVDKILSSFARNSVIQSMGVPDDLTESEDLWDPDNVIPCARCGEPIDFNPGGDEDCTNPNCAPTDDEYTRGGGVSQDRR